MTPLVITELTDGTVAGTGIFDLLMKANKAHLEEEFTKGRIKGTEYATVYLGSLSAVLQTAVGFVLQMRKNDLEASLIAQQILLTTQQTANAVLEGTVLVAQQCKLTAEYDNLMLQKAKTISETTLLNQKTATEQAQTISTGVDADSVVGRQKALYLGQTEGYKRDAEQKAAEILVKTWTVRRTTDEATVADATNLLNDVTIGRTVTKLLAGVAA